ncbi:MerR family transcriptional regulator [Novosphingobium huizhouense]|uniref:MerR family transcriptional regulator n=1 Tax=Novosphingobium huizhouense TaxID=2866625 RepID=UPI001CD8B036|nr:MerR family transcriptional regulator [Novosphingobium huizhouense]
MTDPSTASALLTLGDVTRSTGMAADLLRAWERRYGFPQPLRDGRGSRVYPQAQVERLILLRRLVDHGARPSRIVGLPLAQLELRAAALPGGRGAGAAWIGYSEIVERSVALLAHDRLEALDTELRRDMALKGSRRFLVETAAPLTAAVGTAWETGRIAVHQEHAFAQVMLEVLALARASSPRGSGPRFLLTTPPGEAHGIGLAMAETMIAIEGGRCIPVGLQTPPDEIVAAASAHAVDVVGLSFSTFFSPRGALAFVDDLRDRLDARIALWVGGSCASLARIAAPGLRRFADLDSIGPAIAELQARAPA